MYHHRSRLVIWWWQGEEGLQTQGSRMVLKFFRWIFSSTRHLLHYWDYLLQISSNGENVIGESVTRHFTGEFSVYSMAVRPAGSGAATVWQWFDVKIVLVQAQGCPNLYPGPPNRPQWNDHSFGCGFSSRLLSLWQWFASGSHQPKQHACAIVPLC